MMTYEAEGMELQPRATLRGDVYEMRSRIRFRLHPGSMALAERLRNAQAKQVWGDIDPDFDLRLIAERQETWPEAEGDCAIMELTFTGKRKDARIVKVRHDFMVPAHVRDMRTLNGYAEVVPITEP